MLSDDEFATKRHCVRSNRQKCIYRPCILSWYFRYDLRHFKFCDRVFTQSTKIYDDILASLVPDKYGLENGVVLSGKKLSKHRENAAYLRSESKFRHFAVYHNKNHVITHPETQRYRSSDQPPRKQRHSNGSTKGSHERLSSKSNVTTMSEHLGWETLQQGTDQARLTMTSHDGGCLVGFGEDFSTD